MVKGDHDRGTLIYKFKLQEINKLFSLPSRWNWAISSFAAFLLCFLLMEISKMQVSMTKVTMISAMITVDIKDIYMIKAPA